MRAEITFNGGKSYAMGVEKFMQNKTQLIVDARVIKRCQNTSGFSVHILDDPKPKRPVRAIQKKEPETDV